MIYKYLPLDERTLAGLESKTVLFSQAASFNDPFDMAFHFTSRLRGKHVVAMLRRQGVEETVIQSTVKGAFSSPTVEYDLNQPQRLQRTISPAVLARIADIAAEKQRFAETLATQARVSCFSRSPDSMLLWSHYGGEHFGICLGFEENSAGQEAFFPGQCIVGQDVTYGDSVDINIFDSKSEVAERLADALMRKLSEWSYEAEYRIVIPSMEDDTPERVSIGFDPGRLKEVSFGLRTTARHVQQVRSILQKTYHEYPPRQYQLDKQQARLVRQRLNP